MTLHEWVQTSVPALRQKHEAFETSLLESAHTMERLAPVLPPPQEPMLMFRLDLPASTWASMYHGWAMFEGLLRW